MWRHSGGSSDLRLPPGEIPGHTPGRVRDHLSAYVIDHEAAAKSSMNTELNIK